ncbi:MUB1/samB family protein [Pleurotus pulmonarius]
MKATVWSASSTIGRGLLILRPDPDISDLKTKLRISEQEKPRDGDFSTLTRTEVVLWLKLIGAADLRSRSATDKDVFTRLKHALWDAQRIDNLFHGKVFSENPKLNPSSLPSWPDWRQPHPELIRDKIGVAMPMDGYKDANRLDSYVMRHFNMSAFTPAENQAAVMLNLPPTPASSWIDTKARMGSVALDITRDGVLKFPYGTFYTLKNGVPFSNLILEYMEVKQRAWPEPNAKFLAQLKASQVVKFGANRDAPLVPMIQTPKFPMIIVRYQYAEGGTTMSAPRPSKFLERLQELVRERMPVGATPVEVNNAFKFHLQCGIGTAEPHLRMFARMLSYNSTLLDPAWVNEQQSHWNGIRQDVKKETKISFIAPCLRLRWRALQEIETGIPIKILGLTCHKCDQPAEKLICNSCKSVYYCSKACSVADWQSHKSVCKLSKHLLTHPDDTTAFPAGTFYVPARTYIEFVPESGFAVEQEAVKFSGSTNITEAHKNEYGDTRFIVQTRKPPGYSHMGGKFQGETVFLCDRRRSLLCRTGPGEQPVAKEFNLGYDIPFHAKGYAEYRTLLMQKGYRNQMIYLYAKRVGDCLELDLKDIPDQADCRWQ